MKKRFLFLMMAAVLALSACGKAEPSGTEGTGSSSSTSKKETSVSTSKTEVSASEEPEPEPEETIVPIETITLGKYEQDGDESNGAEPIEWIVLYKENGKALVLSKYILDRMAFNKDYAECTWEKSTLRKELNGNFINNTFTAEEQARIIETKVPSVDPVAFEQEFKETLAAQAAAAAATETSGETSTPAETPEMPEIPSTEDRVFLLSDFEVLKYLTDDPDIAGDEPWGKLSAYALAQGVYELTKEEYLLFKYGDKFPEDIVGAGWWWLRTNGATGFKAMDVASTGEIRVNGHDVIEDHDGLRPAMWVTLH